MMNATRDYNQTDTRNVRRYHSRIIFIGTSAASFTAIVPKALQHRKVSESVRYYVLDVSESGELYQTVKSSWLPEDIRADIEVQRANKDDAAVCEALHQFVWRCDPGVRSNEVILELPPRRFPMVTAACRELATKWFYGSDWVESGRKWAFDVFPLRVRSPRSVGLVDERKENVEAGSAGNDIADLEQSIVSLRDLQACIIRRCYPRRPTALLIASDQLRDLFVAALTRTFQPAFSFMQFVETTESQERLWDWPSQPDLVFSDLDRFATLRRQGGWSNATWVVGSEGSQTEIRELTKEVAKERPFLPEVVVSWSPQLDDCVESLWITRPLSDGAHQIPSANYYQPTPQFDQVRDLWEDGSPKVVALIGLGGSGKTSLTQHLLESCPLTRQSSTTNERTGGCSQADALFIWDFYAQPFSEKFLQSFASYLNPEFSVAANMGECLRLIRLGLQQRDLRRVLLVLDGLETIQRIRADSLDEGELQDSLVLKLLTDIANGELPIVAILTTRLKLVEFENGFNKGYVPIHIGGLPTPAACQLLKSCGGQGSDEQLAELAQRFGNHAMSIYHLGRLLGDFYQGDISAAERLPAVEKTFQQTGVHQIDELNRRFIQLFARYEEHLSEQELAVLKCMAVVGEPLTASEFAQIFPESGEQQITGSLKGLPLDELQARFDALHTRRLLTIHVDNAEAPRYATHPTLSHYFANALTADAEETLSHSMRGYYQRQLEAMVTDYGMTNVAVRTHGAVRTRGAAVGPIGNQRLFPTHAVVLDLLERIIFHTVRSGRAEEARLYYLRRMGGDEHLKSIGQEARAQRITTWLESQKLHES
jgi:hypothetical protein